MAHRKDPAFPMYASEWLSKRTVRRLTAEQRGVLVDLWAIAWTDGPIPDEDVSSLARHFGTTETTVRAMLGQFFSGERGSWISQRLEAERQERAERIDKFRQAAEKTNAKRWGEDNRLATRQASRLATRNGSPSESPSASQGGHRQAVGLSSPLLSSVEQQQQDAVGTSLASGATPTVPSTVPLRDAPAETPPPPRVNRWGVRKPKPEGS